MFLGGHGDVTIMEVVDVEAENLKKSRGMLRDIWVCMYVSIPVNTFLVYSQNISSVVLTQYHYHDLGVNFLFYAWS